MCACLCLCRHGSCRDGEVNRSLPSLSPLFFSFHFLTTLKWGPVYVLDEQKRLEFMHLPRAQHTFLAIRGHASVITKYFKTDFPHGQTLVETRAVLVIAASSSSDTGAAGAANATWTGSRTRQSHPVYVYARCI